MKTLTRNFLRLVVALGLFAAVGLVSTARAEDVNVGTSVATINVSPKLDENDVQQAIMQSLIARKWLIQDKSDGEIVAHYERGRNVATLTIRYDDEMIEIFAVGSARGGGLPMRWILNLKKDIEVYLGRAILTK